MTELPPSTPGFDSRLVESEERYRAVIENASDMIQSCRPDGSFEFVNRAWLEKLGYTAEEVANLNLWDIVHPESVDHCAEMFGKAIEGEPIEDVRATFIAKDGRAVPVEGNATSRFMDGKVVATHSFFRDITERLMAQELEERNAQLERERLARYMEKMAALGKLAAGLAHELNNPSAAAQRAAAQLSGCMHSSETALAALHEMALSPAQWRAIDALRVASSRATAHERRATEVSRLEDQVADWLEDHGIDGGFELASSLVQEGVEPEQLNALEGALPPEALTHVLAWLGATASARDLADVVAKSSQRISELVTAVKAYSFMDRASEQLVDIHEGLENTLVILGHRLRHATLVRDYDRSLPRVKAYGSGLNQVWTNLLDNAADAIGETGTITIRTRGEAGAIIVEVEDDGPGIPEEHLTHVFEPFFSTKPQGQGTGLGLDTVWRIVTEEHGGTIEVKSEFGSTQFRVVLPTP